MITTIAVPPVVINWARRHYKRTSRPYLFGGRPGDCRFDVLAGSHGRYLLTLDPERGRELGLLDGLDGTAGDRAAQSLIWLADAVVCLLGGEPLHFECEDQPIGGFEIIESPFGGHAVRVRGHVSLTCLSWLLCEGRSGYSLGLPGP